MDASLAFRIGEQSKTFCVMLLVVAKSVRVGNLVSAFSPNPFLALSTAAVRACTSPCGTVVNATSSSSVWTVPVTAPFPLAGDKDDKRLPRLLLLSFCFCFFSSLSFLFDDEDDDERKPRLLFFSFCLCSFSSLSFLSAFFSSLSFLCVIFFAF